jgi:hypothetical protein
MTLTVIVIIVVVLLLFGGGGGYYAHRSYGPTGCGSVLAAVLIILLILWFLGVLHPHY